MFQEFGGKKAAVDIKSDYNGFMEDFRENIREMLKPQPHTLERLQLETASLVEAPRRCATCTDFWVQPYRARHCTLPREGSPQSLWSTLNGSSVSLDLTPLFPYPLSSQEQLTAIYRKYPAH